MIVHVNICFERRFTEDTSIERIPSSDRLLILYHYDFLWWKFVICYLGESFLLWNWVGYQFPLNDVHLSLEPVILLFSLGRQMRNYSSPREIHQEIYILMRKYIIPGFNWFQRYRCFIAMFKCVWTSSFCFGNLISWVFGFFLGSFLTEIILCCEYVFSWWFPGCVLGNIVNRDSH